MHRKDVVMIAPQAGDTPANPSRRLIEQTLSNWRGADRPAVVTAAIDEVVRNPAVLDSAALVWMFTDANTPSANLYEIIGQTQDRQLPALLSRDGETEPAGAPFQDGVIIAPPNCSPEALYLMVRSVLSQADVLTALRTEVEILRAHQGGLCDQIDKIDEELRLAAQLQREFLPQRLPTVGNVQFRVLYRPAGYVSGDIYDVVRLDHRHVGFFIADAVGHGVPAALMTVYIKRSLRMLELDENSETGHTIIPPDQALDQLNQDMLRQQSRKVRFATACYGVIDTQTLRISIARAGHPFPLVLRADGSTDWISPEGGLLGVFPEEQYELAEAQLNAGDRLLLYSDGFEVAFPESSPGEDRSTARLANPQYTEVFKSLAHGPVDQALQHLAHQLDQQAGSLHQLDDLTALLIAVDPVATPVLTPPRVVNATAANPLTV